nr:MAG TPA: hypothetical protein [Caudoviricetes sp.]
MSKLSINMRRMIVKYTDICWLITNWKSNRKIRKCCELNNKCHLEAERRIQYREFQGNLCVALDNIPLIPLDGTDNEVLKSCRETFQSYIFNQRGGNE